MKFTYKRDFLGKWYLSTRYRDNPALRWCLLVFLTVLQPIAQERLARVMIGRREQIPISLVPAKWLGCRGHETVGWATTPPKVGPKQGWRTRKSSSEATAWARQSARQKGQEHATCVSFNQKLKKESSFHGCVISRPVGLFGSKRSMGLVPVGALLGFLAASWLIRVVRLYL